MEPTVDIFRLRSMYRNAIKKNDLDEIERLVELDSPIMRIYDHKYLTSILGNLNGSQNEAIINLVLSKLVKDGITLNMLFSEIFNYYKNPKLGRWIVNRNQEVSKEEMVNFDRYITIAIDSYNEKELKFLTDIGLISGYVDGNGELMEDFKATRAYFDNNIRYPRYQRTDRPINKMSYTPSNCSRGLYLPIVRYRSLYYKTDIENKYCGTFYFYEPDSNNFLNLGNVLVAANKMHAILILEKSSGVPVYKSLIEEEFERLTYYVSGWGDTDSVIEKLMYVLPNEKDPELQYLPNFTNLLYENGSSDNYIGDEIIGDFDYLDEHICEMARQQGYDTVLLQREPGEYRAVTEIYDVRLREVSLQNICKDTLEWNIPKTKYPAIWFSTYGFVEL